MENETLKNLIAPTQEVRQKRIEMFKNFALYMVIIIILLIVLFVVPFIAGGINAEDFGYYLPKSTAGWIVFWAIRGGTVVGNIAVFALFKSQAKINSKNHPNFIEANELLNAQNGKQGFIPRSPKSMNKREWLSKGITMIVFTAAESIVIGSLVLNFDIMTFLSCLTSSVTAVLFGIVTMLKNEVYWTEEYLLYAKYITSQEKEAQNGLYSKN